MVLVVLTVVQLIVHYVRLAVSGVEASSPRTCVDGAAGRPLLHETCALAAGRPLSHKACGLAAGRPYLHVH